MRAALLGLLAVVVFVALVVGAVRRVNNVATQVTVREVEPGIRCAIATTMDGVSIDCWEMAH